MNGMAHGEMVALGWTLLHFCWQGTAVAMVYAVADRVAARTSGAATVRYAVALLALATMPLIVGATFADEMSLVRSVVTGSPAGADTTVQPGAMVSMSELAKSSIVREIPLAPMVVERGELMMQRAEKVLPWVDGIWLLGVMLLAVRALGGWWQLEQVRKRAKGLVPAEVGVAFRQMCARLDMGRRVVLRVSDEVISPLAMGVLRATVILPVSSVLRLPIEELEAVLAHELAHIRRWDYLFNLMQTAVESVLFFHPAVWWMSHRVRERREICCDEVAARNCADPVVYARALLLLEEQRTVELQLAVALDGRSGSLLGRVKQVLGEGAAMESRMTSGVQAAAVGAVVLGLLVAPGMPAAVAKEVVQEIKQSPVVQAVVPQIAAPAAKASAPIAAAPPAEPKVEVSSPAAVAEPAAPAQENGREHEVPVAERKADREAQRAVTEEIRGSIRDLPGNVQEKVREAVRTYPNGQRTYEVLTRDYSSGSGNGRGSGYAYAYANAVASPNVSVTVSPNPSPNPDPNPNVDVDVKVKRYREQVAASGSGKAYIDGMRDAGYPMDLDKDLDVLISLKSVGVTPEYAKQMADAGLGKPTAHDLISLKSVGVTPEYMRGMKTAGLDPKNIHDLVGMKSVGVTPEYAQQMKAAGFDMTNVRDLIGMRSVGITPEYVKGMKASGLSPDNQRDLLGMKSVGVTPEYAAEMKAAGFDVKNVHELISMKSVGVTPEYVKGMRAGGINPENTRDLISMKSVGVTPEYVQSLKAKGVNGLGGHDIVSLRATGVTPEYVAFVKQQFGTTDVRQIQKARALGVDEKFVEAAKSHGFDGKDLDKMVRLKSSGLLD